MNTNRNGATNLLDFLVNPNSSVITVYNAVTANIQCQHHLKYLKLIFTTETRNINNIYVRITVSNLIFSFLCYQRNNNQHWMLCNIDKKYILYKSLIKKIAYNYVRIVVLYYLFMYYGISGIFSWHQMLDIINLAGMARVGTVPVFLL